MSEALQRTEVVNGSPLSYVTEKNYDRLPHDRVITVCPDGTGTIRISAIHQDGPPKVLAEDVADNILPVTIYGVGYTDIILTNISGTTHSTIASSERA